MITLSYPKLFLLIFGIKEGEVAPDYELIMRIYSLSFLFYSFNKFVQCYYPSVLKNLPSFLNTVLQHSLLGIALGIDLLYALKDIGYATSVVLIESLSLVITMVFVLIYSRKKKLESILLIPKYKSGSQKEELTVKSLEGVDEMKKKIKD